MAEKVTGGVILLLLLVIAVGIYVKGQHFDPELFSPTVSELKQEKEEKVSSLIDTNLSQKWKTMGDVEFYSADNLYEKINGKAEQYHDYNVVGLQTVTFVEKDGNRFADLYVYDMGKPINAFGIFSAIRSPGENPVDLGQDGYKSDGYFFWKGKYYVQVVLSDSGEDIENFALKLAKDVASKIDKLPLEIWVSDKFPEENLVPNSIQYFKKEALNLSFLNDVYVSIYEKDGTEIKAFLSKRNDQQEAEKIFESYREYLSKYGNLVEEDETKSANIIVGEMFGYYDVVFKKDNIIGGTNSVENRQYAEEISKKLLSSLSN